MNSVAKLGVFAVVIAACFGGAMAVGAAVGPIDVGGARDHASHSTVAAQVAPAQGVTVAEAGYRLTVESTTVTAGSSATFAFRIVDGNGDAVTHFDEWHDRPLHLIVLSRNLVDYLHIHPTMDPSGRWTVALPALRPASYRVFADFQPNGAENITLGTDITVLGNVEAVAVPEPSTVASVEGYTVALAGTPVVGETELSFTVELAGKSVSTDPYLGAAGHLVVIRSADLAYLHVHPGAGTTAPAVTFTGEFPTAGRYRLFFDFAHGGSVHTAAFTVDVPDGHPSDSIFTHAGGH